VIFWGPDEDRALQPLDYAWTLWENQVQRLKEAWPLAPPRAAGVHEEQLANDSVLVALPGKDPDRIRKGHPTIVFFDEAAIIERFEESYGIALDARPVKIVAISSAKPGEFRKITEPARTVPWPYPPPPRCD
jgi:hypothetical protein